MEKVKLTEDIEILISNGQYNGQDDKLKDVITNEGVCRDINTGDNTFGPISEFTMDMIVLLLGYMAVTSGEFETENDFRHAVSKYAALFDINSDHYFDEEKKLFDLERLVYDITTKVYEGYWNYDEISKYPEELALFTEVYNNDIQTILNSTDDKSIAMQALNPKTILFYHSRLMTKTPENKEEEMKMVAKLETLNDLSNILAKSINDFDEDDRDLVFLDSIKGDEINNIMDKDTTLKLTKTLMMIFNGYYDSQQEKDGPLLVFNLMGKEGMILPLTFSPKFIEDFKFLVSLLVLRLFKDKNKFNEYTFDSIFSPKDKDLAEKVMDSLISDKDYKEEIITDSNIYNESGNFALFEAIKYLTSTLYPCNGFLNRYKFNEDFTDIKEIYESLESKYSKSEKEYVIFHTFESKLLFNLIYSTFMGFLAISEGREIYNEFLKTVREIIHNGIEEGKRNVSIITDAYNVVSEDEFFDICTLAQKINALSTYVENYILAEYFDSDIDIDKNKLS